MMNSQADVDKFMRAAEQPVRDEPTVLDKAEEMFRIDLIEEETNELIEAIKALGRVRGDLVNDEELRDLHADALDGIVDSVFVIVGAASALGYNFHNGWNEVVRSNMSKVDTESGKLVRRADGKVLKPEHFIPADFNRVIYGES